MRNRNRNRIKKSIPEEAKSILNKHHVIARHEIITTLEREGSSKEIIIIRVRVRVRFRIRVRRFVRRQAV